MSVLMAWTCLLSWRGRKCSETAIETQGLLPNVLRAYSQRHEPISYAFRTWEVFSTSISISRSVAWICGPTWRQKKCSSVGGEAWAVLLKRWATRMVRGLVVPVAFYIEPQDRMRFLVWRVVIGEIARWVGLVGVLELWRWYRRLSLSQP
jgi:hypothetical protein